MAAVPLTDSRTRKPLPPIRSRSPNVTCAVSPPENPEKRSRSRAFVSSSTNSVASPPLAKVALRLSPLFYAKLNPSVLLDVEYPAGTYPGCGCASNASNPFDSGSRTSAVNASQGLSAGLPFTEKVTV